MAAVYHENAGEIRSASLASCAPPFYARMAMERSRGTRLATRIVAWGGFLYVAIQLHAFLGFGGYEIGENHVDKVALMRLGQDVRERVRQSEQTFDIEGLDVGMRANDQEPNKPPPPPPQPKPEKKKEEKKPDDLKKPDQPKPPEKKAIPLLVKTDPKKVEPQQVQPVMPDKRIAVRQHVQPNQDDNPNAHFIGDQANHVEQESVATQTSHDQDDPNP